MLDSMQETKRAIGSMSYKEMLRRWRFAPIGDPLFQGESGEYFRQKMVEKRAAEQNPATVPKRIRWEL